MRQQVLFQSSYAGDAPLQDGSASEAVAAGGPSRTLAVAGTIARRLAVPVAIIVVWQLASLAGWINLKTLASPAQVVAAFDQLWITGQLWPNVWISLQRVVLGLALGVSIGTVCGLAAGLSRLGEELVDAPLQMLRTLPFLGLLPLLIVWLGIGEGIKIGLVTIGVIFPIYLNLHKGIRAVDPRFRELAQSCGVGRWGLITRVIIPGALPSFLVGLRFSLGIAWLSLVVAETVNADKGVGYLLMQGQQFLQTDIIVLGLVIYAILGLLLEGLVRIAEWRLLPWRREFLAS
jgi:sulfonate transport system permease protein